MENNDMSADLRLNMVLFMNRSAILSWLRRLVRSRMPMPGTFDDLPERRPAGNPAQNFLGGCAVGDQDGRVARTPASRPKRDRRFADLFHHLQHFPHRMSFPRAQIEGATRSPVDKIFQGEQMSGTQVVDVYVVAYRCAIVGWVIRPKD